MGRTDIATSEAPSNQDADTDQMERLVGVGVGWKLTGQIFIQGVRLVTVAILARLLSPADYGAAAIPIALAMFAPTVADMGMASALVQVENATQRVRSTTLWASLAFGIGLSALFAASAAPVGRFLGDPQVGTMVAAGGLTFAICSIGSTSQAVFMREMRFRSIELRYWFALVVASVLAVVAASAGAGSWALVLQQIFLLSTFAAALWWRVPWRPTLEFSGAAFRRLGYFAIRVAGGRWVRLIELLALFLLIGKLLSVPALGAWMFAMSTVILPLTVIAIPIAEVLFSAFSRLRGERERMAALWLESVRYLAAVVLPLLTGLVVLAPDLIPTVFGSHWVVSVGIIQILSVYVVIRSLQSWGSVLMDAVGRPQVTLWTQLTALCTTPLGVVIGAHWGIEAVAVGFVLSQLIAVEVPMLIIVLSELRISLSSVAARLYGVAAATVMMATICFAERLVLSDLGVGVKERLTLTIGLALLVYAIALWWLAPDIVRRAIGIGRGLVARVRGPRRRATRVSTAPLLDRRVNGEPGTAAPRNPLGGRWVWGGLAIAVLVPVLAIAGWRSSGTDGGDASQQPPQAVSAASAAPAAPVVGVDAHEKARKGRQRPRRRNRTAASPLTRRPPATVDPAPAYRAVRPPPVGGRPGAHPVRSPSRRHQRARSHHNRQAREAPRHHPIPAASSGLPATDRAGAADRVGATERSGGNGPGGTGPPGQMR